MAYLALDSLWLIFGFLLYRFYYQKHQLLPISKSKRHRFGEIIVLAGALCVVVIVLNNILHNMGLVSGISDNEQALDSVLNNHSHVLTTILQYGYVLVSAPAFETTAVICGYLALIKHLNANVSSAIVSLIFGSLHMANGFDFGFLLIYAVIGLMFILFYRWNHHLLSIIGVHALYNLSGLVPQVMLIVLIVAIAILMFGGSRLCKK